MVLTLMEGRPWQHFYSSPEQSLSESSEVLDGVPSLVAQLAHSVLRLLQEEGSPDSSAALEDGSLTDLVVAAGGKPLPIATSGSPSPSPTPSPRRPRRISSSSASVQARANNGRFSEDEES